MLKNAYVTADEISLDYKTTIYPICHGNQDHEATMSLQFVEEPQ